MKTYLTDDRTWLQVDGKWHRLDCIDNLFKWKKEHDKYVRNHPNYCRTCGGSGVLESSENAAPHGSGRYWPMRTDSECPDCTEKNVCPMCGKQYEPSWEGASCSCGWNWQGKDCDHMPAEWECYCELFPNHPIDAKELMEHKRIRPFYIT